jgi:hypothetical protein
MSGEKRIGIILHGARKRCANGTAPAPAPGGFNG